MSITTFFRPTLLVYQDPTDEWRWSITVAATIVGASSKGFKNREDCIADNYNLEKRIIFLREKDYIN